MIVDFLMGRGADNRGRTLEQVLAKSDEWWEDTHDFIQWVFPTDQKSQFNSSAPVLDSPMIVELAGSDTVRANMLRIYKRAREFWKLDGDEPPFWARRGDHNHLRQTRALISLNMLGIVDEASGLYQDLTRIAGKVPGAVSPETLRFWSLAVGRRQS